MMTGLVAAAALARRACAVTGIATRAEILRVPAQKWNNDMGACACPRFESTRRRDIT